MDVFQLRDDLIADYESYVRSFMAIRDGRIRDRVEDNLAELWPPPSVGLNPAFEPGGWVDELVAEGLLDPACERIFRVGKGPNDPFGQRMRLHRHQVDAISAAARGDNYVLTTGTGSGKSLAYIVPIVDHVLRHGSGNGIKAIVVYPMNALANSQMNELEKFLGHGLPGGPPLRVEKYTGEVSTADREAFLHDPPDVILTNYVMLELILTRVTDRRLVRAAQGLRYLVLDELHTYRGRQGADVALLARRVREACSATDLQCIGTSATLSSEGSLAERRQAVADTASRIFGAPVTADGVIGETLRRTTPPIDDSDPAVVERLRDRLKGPGAAPTGYDELLRDPLSSWIESTFGVTTEEEQLVRVEPRTITGESGGARDLARLTGIDEPRCAAAIKAQLMAGYEAVDPDTGARVFAFRLHQFVSKGDTVYASAEPESTRHLTLRGQLFVPGHGRDKALFPLAFCRMCGQEYYTVSELTAPDEPTRYVPRDLGSGLVRSQQAAGFLYLCSDPEGMWPEERADELERVPEDWLEITGAGAKLSKSAARLLPSRRRVAGNGEIDNADGQLVWWVPAPFRMCLHCGVAYPARMSDRSKLTTLGSEGRSTATTVLSLSTVRELRADETLRPEARKLLSFTDNRQDASLQAGHFNDFVRTSLLRGALFRAMERAGEQGLTHDRIAAAVFETLDLPFEAYAGDPLVEFQAKRSTQDVLRDVLGHLVYSDLERGWRINLPNLEQCGLIRIDYPVLEEVCAAEHVWQDSHPVLAAASPEERGRVARVLLDYLRRSLAVKVDYLDAEWLKALARRSEHRLAEAWDLGSLKPSPVTAPVMLPRSRARGDDKAWAHVSARSGFGRFLRRVGTFSRAAGTHLTLADTETILAGLFEGLRRGGLVEQVLAAKDGTPGYQVPADCMVWRAGDGKSGYHDPVRMPAAPRDGLPPNDYFVDLYRNLARDLIGVEAREHTAQVRYEDRQVREERFRDALLPVLYCSPTMELGVDIADLNVVNMRNVPPTPANYAQRSGRAGRSGQPALVFTYCSSGSPHDQWFFRRPQLMVSGAVKTPRLDLANEDLLRAHVQAIWLAAAGLDLKGSLADLLDLDDPAAPKLNQQVAEHLHDPAARVAARAVAERVLADIIPDLGETPWWGPAWLDDVLNAVPLTFSAATKRWRSLYRSATRQRELQHQVILDNSATPAARAAAKRLRADAERQLELLQAQADDRNQSDFYSYRYFAGEGFLPGYSFPRLPLSAFIPGRMGAVGEGSFVSRPRFLAVSEFGPHSIVYHEGNRYQIDRVILPVGDSVDPNGGPQLTTRAKVCERCGYLHAGAESTKDTCEHCSVLLPHAVGGLFRLYNVATRRRDRISSDEEERQRQGFELHTAYRFAERDGRVSLLRASVRAEAADRELATLVYGDTATLWRINVGQRRRADADRKGFLLDIDRGYWKPEKDALGSDGDDEDPTGSRLMRVIPYVEDTRNCLVVTPSDSLSVSEMASVQAALKHAIQVEFQLEDDELAAEPLPSADARHALLLYEAAEGGAGVLRRLAEDPRSLAAVARRAVELCHFDPNGTDHGAAANGGDGCAAACYDCLLSYRNQLDHPQLDRHAALPTLQALTASVVQAGAGGEGADTLVERLTSAADSELEQRWLDEVRRRGLRLPDRSQILIEECCTRPDFVYDGHYAAVYVDGPDHDFPDRQRRDADQAACLRNQGYTVIRFGHSDDWAQTFDSFRWVFGEGGA